LFGLAFSQATSSLILVAGSFTPDRSHIGDVVMSAIGARSSSTSYCSLNTTVAKTWEATLPKLIV
jgi:hypothetical protein